jgi:hypothetical protein
LLATGPNQLWTWDITKLLRPAKWTYFYLYAILDVFSRYVVGWMVADREGKELAKQFIAATCEKHEIAPGQLTLHADHGSSMKSKPVAFPLADLGVTKTHSRPHVSDDNPFSGSQFKTVKYRPEFPDRRASVRCTTPGAFARSSSPGTTPSIITPVSGCRLRRSCIISAPRKFATSASKPSTRLMPLTRNALSGNLRSRLRCPPRSGSTRHPSLNPARRIQTRKLNKLCRLASQNS